MRDERLKILQYIFSKIKILCQRYDTEFNLVDSKTIVATDVDHLSQMLFPFNCSCCEYLFFVYLQGDQNPNGNFLYPFKKWLDFCWQHALKQRKIKLNEHDPIPVVAKHDDSMREFSSLKEFAKHFINYTNNFSSEINWSDYEIIIDGLEGELSYGKKTFSDVEKDVNNMELAIFSFVTEDFFNAIKKTNPFRTESTGIIVLQILESPLPLIADSEKVMYNDENMLIFTNNISKDIGSLSEIDIQHSLDENISRNNSGNIKSEH